MYELRLQSWESETRRLEGRYTVLYCTVLCCTVWYILDWVKQADH